LATVLSAKYGITVSTIGVLANLAIPSFDITLTQTPYEVIEQVARYAQLLVYDGTDGNLILAQAGATSMASGFTQGLNVQEASVTFSMDERYSSVEAVTCATDTLLTDPDNQNFSAEAGLNGIAASISYDKGVPRYRPLIIIAEQGDTNYAVTIARSQWEINRRIGRSQAVRVMTDSWFDSSGKLWAKNALAPINLPSLKITNQNWLIGSVTFTRDEGGTRADLVLMPQAAFQPEPVLLLPYNGEITQAENAGAAATDIDPDAPGPLVGFTPGGAQ
jgi:prophage tail gpP-like protein